MAYLIGAYGLFWQRSEVEWQPGRGSGWQLLGKRALAGRKSPIICDFRKAHGFYILYNEHRANYVGLAAGQQGIGARLLQHHLNRTSLTQDWTRFSWFSLDDVVPASTRATDGWAQIEHRSEATEIGTRAVLSEFEALLIQVLGTLDQNQMRFNGAEPWEQVTSSDAYEGGALHAVDRAQLTDAYFRDLLNQVEDDN